MPETENRQLSFIYKNWRGESSQRNVMPLTIWFGVTEWHPRPQWFLRATDLDKNESRDFAMQDIEFIRQPE